MVAMFAPKVQDTVLNVQVSRKMGRRDAQQLQV